MKKVLLAIVAVVTLSICGWTKVVDKLIATVKLDAASKPEVIMLSELEKNVNPLIDQFKQLSPAAEQTKENIAELKKRALDQMIDEKIILQEAKKRQIKVTRNEIQQGLADVKKRFETETEFNSELKKQGFTLIAFEKRIEEQLMAIKLINIEVKSKITAPKDDEVKSFYDKIMVRMDKKLATTATEEEKELDNLAQLVKRRFGERIRVKHILLQVKKGATTDEKTAVKSKITDIKSRLDKGEDFEDLAKKYSEDPGSKERGGELPSFGKGEMVPEFEKAAFALQVGVVSDIVETEFGFHIIKCEEKKAAAKANLSDIKDDLAMYLAQKKMESQYKDWLKILRSKASIKTYPIE